MGDASIAMLLFFWIIDEMILDPFSESDLGSVPLTQAMIFRWEELKSWLMSYIVLRNL